MKSFKRKRPRSNSYRLTCRKIYRKRVKTSKCRGKSYGQCSMAQVCTRTRSGKRRSYCRYRINRKCSQS